MTQTLLRGSPEEANPRPGAGRGRFGSLGDRTLDHYPTDGPRLFYLGLVVVSAIVLYYQFYVQASVTPSIIAQYHMTWPFFVYLVVVGNAVGAFASLVGGLSDRWGRANIVTWGLLGTSLIVLFGLPNAPNLWVYGVLYSVLGFIEGVMLVATPALVRDFSPQMGRASAMGFWTMGPVVGSLIVAEVSSQTLSHLHAWQDQFTISGIVGLVVFVVALLGLRELAPGIRDQVMVSENDRVLVEARASGVDVEETMRHPWRQMLHADIVGPALGIGVFLIIYYTLIAFIVVYMGAIFGYSQQRANSLGNWMWAFQAVALVAIGWLSDRFLVRKPFMTVGIIGSATATVLFALRATHPETGYYTFVWMLTMLSVFLGFTFAPWMAAFTETVEKRNPALTATGLALFGWVLRFAVAASLFILPYVVTSMTPLVEHGQQVQAVVSRFPTEVATLQAIEPGTAATLSANPGDTAAITAAVGQISTRLHVTSDDAVQRLVALSKVPKNDLTTLSKYGAEVQKASAVAPHEWQRWWWVSVGGELALFPFLFLMTGRWSSRRAHREAAEHEAWVRQEIAALRAGAAESE